MTTPAHPSSSAQSTPSAAPAPAQAALPQPTDAQQQVLERIALQRTRLRARRAARTQALVLAGHGHTGGAGGQVLALRAACFVREHPWAVAALAAGALIAGPRRILRWTGIALPLLMRLKALAAGR